MGEQPLFSCKAHVFQLEPELKKSWIALSTTAVNVQIFHDSIKNIYRIVSVEGPKALINSIVTPRMTFTKTSQKFGQWIDFKLNLVYGLGFSNDVELNKFVDKFKEIKELTRNQIFLRPHERSNSCEITSLSRVALNSGGSENSNQSESIEQNLKVENERLKLSLTQSNHTARKLEEELQLIKNNNLRLTNALQESHSNTVDIKNQLQYYTDECVRLRSNNNSKTTNSSELNDLYDKNNPKFKQDLIKLTDNFDRKLNELNEIRQQLKNLINDLQ